MDDHRCRVVNLSQYFDILPVDVTSLQTIHYSPDLDRVEGFLVLHKCHTLLLIILFSLLYKLPNSMDVVYGIVAFSKPSLLAAPVVEIRYILWRDGSLSPLNAD